MQRARIAIDGRRRCTGGGFGPCLPHRIRRHCLQPLRELRCNAELRSRLLARAERAHIDAGDLLEQHERAQIGAGHARMQIVGPRDRWVVVRADSVPQQRRAGARIRVGIGDAGGPGTLPCAADRRNRDDCRVAPARTRECVAIRGDELGQTGEVAAMKARAARLAGQRLRELGARPGFI